MRPLIHTRMLGHWPSATRKDKIMKVTGHLLSALLLVGLGNLAHAQSEFYRRVTPPGAAEGGIAGAAVLVGREYQGSDEVRVRLLPSIEYQWANGFFAGGLNGVGYNASSSPDKAYGVRITPDFGRKERRSAVLEGLGDIDPRPEIGAFYNFSPARQVTFSSSLRYGSGNSRKGLLVDVGASWSTSVTPALRVATTLATTWANGEHLQEYFGITAAQSTRSGLAAYSPSGGLKDVRLGVSLFYRLTPEWSLTGAVSHSELVGDARHSPIVREKGTVTGVLAVGYSF